MKWADPVIAFDGAAISRDCDSSPPADWGAGQPSAFHAGIRIFLAYTDTSAACRDMLYWVASASAADGDGNMPSAVNFDAASRRTIPLGKDIIHIDVAYSGGSWHAATAYGRGEGQVQLWRSDTGSLSGPWRLSGRIGVITDAYSTTGNWMNLPTDKTAGLLAQPTGDWSEGSSATASRAPRPSSSGS